MNKCCFKIEIFLFLYLYVIFTCMCIESKPPNYAAEEQLLKSCLLIVILDSSCLCSLLLCFKIMLLDEFTTKLLSSCCKMTDLLEEGVTGKCCPAPEGFGFRLVILLPRMVCFCS